jgi:hypothetical protein
MSEGTLTDTTNSKPRSIGIVTLAEDLHAHVISKTMQEKYGVECFIVESDRIGQTGQINWSPHQACVPTLPAFDGAEIDVRTLGLIWWRRPGGNSWKKSSRCLEGINDEAALDIIKNDCLASFQGVLFSEFDGIWVSAPEATRRAENKLVQLRAAMRAGLRIPRTLVSQNPAAIREFCSQQPTIIKTVAGTTKIPLMALEVSSDLLSRDDSLSVSPAIYQEQVFGRQHLRVHAFGNTFHTALLTCDQLDWRVHLDQMSVEPYSLPRAMQAQLRQFMKIMNLSMGIFDLKINERGEMVWLEVNPQGQFLFLEGMSEMKLADAFADFLYAISTGRESLH